MRKSSNIGRAVLYGVVGLIIGNVAGDLLGQAHVPYVAQTTSLRWQPGADLHMVKYHLDLQITINMVGLVGGCAGLWFSRKR
ncbi:MAG: DUF4321 domain-containing protein [Kyrpidia sp.]|nr:DUF4321 domain-containing protein [Kyrpidia sp.]